MCQLKHVNKLKKRDLFIVFFFESRFAIKVNLKMITHTTLGKKGNLGNQLFQIASTIGIAKKNGQNYVFPKWIYADYFNYDFPVIENDSDMIFEKIFQKSYSYCEWELGEGNYDIKGYLQSEKYFDRDITKKIFEFKDDFIKPILARYSHLFERKNIIITVRRGDFVNHPNFYQLPYKYYFLALNKNFPDWKERNLIFMSDDINYCKFHFKFLKNAFFIEDLSAIEQLALSSNGDDFIISNSTFSWWMAWLSEKNEGKVIRPPKNFSRKFSKKNDDSDFFPERWIVFDYKKHSMNAEYPSLIIKGFCFQTKENFKYPIKIYKRFIQKIKKDMSKLTWVQFKGRMYRYIQRKRFCIHEFIINYIPILKK